MFGFNPNKTAPSIIERHGFEGCKKWEILLDNSSLISDNAQSSGPLTPRHNDSQEHQNNIMNSRLLY